MLKVPSRTQPDWTSWKLPLLALATLLVLLFALYWESFAELVSLWRGSENYAHALLVPPIALWLAFRRRHQTLSALPRAELKYLPILVAAAMAWLVGDLGQTNALVHFAVVTLLVALILLILGTDVAKTLIFPLGFVYFAVPFGEFLYPYMMNATADFTVGALRLSGVPVYREGLFFVIPSGNWSVIEACSGLRYLIASAMVGALFGYLNFQTNSKRFVFFGVSIVVPLVANWVRAYMIVMLGHLSGNKLAVGVDHLIYGWVFFGFVMLLMFVIGGKFADQDALEEVKVPAQSPSGDAPTKPSVARLGTSVALAVVTLALPQVIMERIQSRESDAPPVLSGVAQVAAGWQPTGDTVLPAWTPEYMSPSASLQQSFTGRQGDAVGLYIAYYRHQDARRKLVTSENQLVRSKNELWARVASSHTTTGVPEGELGLNEEEIRSAATVAGSEQRLLVWQLYWVDGRWTESPAKAKLLGTIQRLLGRGDDGASVVFYTDKTANEGARETLAAFVRENLSVIDSQLRRVHDGGVGSIKSGWIK